MEDYIFCHNPVEQRDTLVGGDEKTIANDRPICESSAADFREIEWLTVSKRP